MLTRAELLRLALPIEKTEPTREQERQVLLDLLRLEPGNTICDAPAWYGYLADGAPDRSSVICIEPVADFVKLISPGCMALHVAKQDALPLGTATVDRFASLVGLHHWEDKRGPIREAKRVTKTDGIIAVSEVSVMTPVADFLDGPVKTYAMGGHKGWFVHDGELAGLLEEAGCTDVREHHHQLYWAFRTTDSLVTYFYGLLGLAKATREQVLGAVFSHFDVEVSDHLIKVPWALTYASGRVSR